MKHYKRAHCSLQCSVQNVCTHSTSLETAVKCRELAVSLGLVYAPLAVF